METLFLIAITINIIVIIWAFFYKSHKASNMSEAFMSQLGHNDWAKDFKSRHGEDPIGNNDGIAIAKKKRGEKAAILLYGLAFIYLWSVIIVGVMDITYEQKQPWLITAGVSLIILLICGLILQTGKGFSTVLLFGGIMLASIPFYFGSCWLLIYHWEIFAIAIGGLFLWSVSKIHQQGKEKFCS